MMGRLLACAVVVLAGGCGSSSAKGSSLEGKWGYEDAKTGCEFAFTFQGSDYELDLICPLQDGGTGISAEVGTFDYADATLSLHPERSSCSNASAAAYDLSARLNGDQLSVTDGSAIVAYKRLTDVETGGTGAANYGCFDGAGAFTPGAVSPI